LARQSDPHPGGEVFGKNKRPKSESSGGGKILNLLTDNACPALKELGKKVWQKNAKDTDGRKESKGGVFQGK